MLNISDFDFPDLIFRWLSVKLSHFPPCTDTMTPLRKPYKFLQLFFVV